MNCKCGVAVIDGANGTIDQPPPWGAESAATCFACENQAIEDAEHDRVRASLDAAARAGRFDCM